MSRWPLKPLGEICSTTSGGTPSRSRPEYFGGGIPWIKSGDLTDADVVDCDETITEEALKQSSAKLFRQGTVLIAMYGATVGKLGMLGIDAASNQAVCGISTPDELDRWFLFFFLLSQRQKLIDQSAGGAQPNISQKIVRELLVPVPPLPEQRRIIDLLSRAQGIVRLRREAEKKAAELIPALFLDMFGDPATNPKGWPEARLGDLADKMSDGPFGSNLKSSHYVESGVRVLRLQNIGIGRLIDDVKAFVSHEHFASLPRHRCLPGDVIIGTLGDPNLRAFVMPPTIPEALNKADCVQFRCRHDVAIPAFVCWLMNMPSTLTMAASLVQGITLTRISMGRLRELVVPVPPLALQRDFAKSVEAADSIQSQQSVATVKAQAAFDALLARAFVTNRTSL
jgi:type I restriction enzyme, S subunit